MSTLVVRQVDHILIQVQDLDYLYSLFTTTFKLPVAWPIQLSNPRFQTGGVVFGDVNIEVLRFAAPLGPLRDRPDDAHLFGFALEPIPLDDALPELTRRGVEHDPPFAYERPLADGTRLLVSTIVRLTRQFGEHDGWMFMLSQYNHDVPKRRGERMAELKAREGGPLGLLGVKEIVLGVHDLADQRRRWGALLEPRTETAPGYWQFEGGPALRLVADDQDRGVRLVLRVADLKPAARFLGDVGLLGRASPSEIRLDPAKVQNLDLRLQE